GSARSGSPTPYAATRSSPQTCSARSCWSRRGTSRPRRAPPTWPSWPPAAPAVRAQEAADGGTARPAARQPHPRRHTSGAPPRLTRRGLAGNLAKAGEKLAAQNRLFVRDRLALLLDAGSFVEHGLLANNRAEDLPADGVVTGVGRIEGRPVCVVANDPTVK